MNSKKLSLAFLLSGGGRTLQNIIDKIDGGFLNAAIKLVISNKSDAYGLIRAKKAAIPAVHIEYPKSEDASGFSNSAYQKIEAYGVDLIVLGGFMRPFLIKPGWKNRVINIHPSLIPAFCGRGYYGERVHRAVLEYGAKISGCTVHFVDEEYDRGPIILQSPVPVMESDSPAALSERVFIEECRLYPRALKLFGEDRIRVEGRKVFIEDENRE